MFGGGKNDKNNEKRGGNNRDWGYASYVLDDEEAGEEPKLIYTSIEKSGKVNQYGDNGDGKHSHAEWNSKEDFDAGEAPDWERRDSGTKNNPDDNEINDMAKDGSCYLTTACMHHYKYNFDDKCSELEVLRWFRDNYCTKEEVEHYYKVAPKIVSHINSRNNSDEFYEYIYNALILRSIMAIGNNDFDLAHKIYTKHVQALESALHIYGEDDKEMQSDEEAEFSK